MKIANRTMKRYRVRFSVRYDAEIFVSPDDILADVVSNVEIPEGGKNKATYVENSFWLHEEAEIDYIQPEDCTQIRISDGFDPGSVEIDGIDDFDYYTEECWTHYDGKLLDLETAKRVVPEFCDEIGRPDLVSKVTIVKANQ